MWKPIMKPLAGALLFVSAGLAQNASLTTDIGQGGAIPVAQAGTPEGSYELSGFETVNPFSGKLNVSIPLLKVGGRGDAGYTISLGVQTSWLVQTIQIITSGAVNSWGYAMVPVKSGIDPYSPGGIVFNASQENLSPVLASSRAAGTMRGTL
jgi:hypothetical protein